MRYAKEIEEKKGEVAGLAEKLKGTDYHAEIVGGVGGISLPDYLPSLRLNFENPDELRYLENASGEVKDGKFKEYMKRFYQNILEYFDIEGYKVDFEVFMSGAEALPLVGLEMPEV